MNFGFGSFSLSLIFMQILYFAVLLFIIFFILKIIQFMDKKTEQDKILNNNIEKLFKLLDKEKEQKE